MDHHHTRDDRLHEEYLGHVNIDRAVPSCDDQLPSIARVGRGLHGDDYRVNVQDKRPVDPLLSGWQDQSPAETYLTGEHYDHAEKTWTTDWVSENVSGGQLFYQYSLRPFTTPKTFTMTFIYRRPENPLLPGEQPGNDPDEWSWTTPAIPYWPSTDGSEDPTDNTVVGSGVGTLFLRYKDTDEWTEMLIYPDGTTRDDFNAPDALEPWTVNITLEDYIGDIERFIDEDELAKVVGTTKTVIQNIINGDTGQLKGADNIIDYIDQEDQEIIDVIQPPAEWADPGTNLPGDSPDDGFGPGSQQTIWDKFRRLWGIVKDLIGNGQDNLTEGLYRFSGRTDYKFPCATMLSATQAEWSSYRRSLAWTMSCYRIGSCVVSDIRLIWDGGSTAEGKINTTTYVPMVAQGTPTDHASMVVVNFDDSDIDFIQPASATVVPSTFNMATNRLGDIGGSGPIVGPSMFSFGLQFVTGRKIAIGDTDGTAMTMTGTIPGGDQLGGNESIPVGFIKQAVTGFPYINVSA